MSLARVAEVLVWWALLVGVWVLTLSSAPPMEVSIAAASALPCAVAAVVARRAVDAAWRPQPGWVRWLAVLPVAIVVDTVLVLGGAVRSLLTRDPFEGELTEVRLRGHDDPRRSAAHRALATITLSTTPGSFVMDTRPDDDTLLLHTLVDAPPSLEEVVSS